MLLSQTFAYDPADTVERRREKYAIFIVAGACCVSGCLWSIMYWAIFGWGLTTALPALFVVIVGSAMLVSHLTKNHYYAVYAQIFCIMYITAFIQWSIGGVFDSGFVLAWAFVGPISALIFFELRGAAICFVLYLINVAITVAFDDFFRQHALEVSETTKHFFFVMNLCVSSAVVLLFASYYVYSAATEHKRAEALQHDLDETKKKQLGPYTLEQKLGEGGMGVVFLARHALLRRPTAIKLLSSTNARPQHLERFEREVQLTSELTHPNIVAIYDYGHSPEGEFYYAMEYLPGVDLQTLVDRWGPLPTARVVAILHQVCDALEDAHHRGLIHRDIKPANIILSRLGLRADVAKVVDFGLVKDVQGPSDLTGDNAVAGTPAYLAPEALVAPDDVGPPSDIYAMGAVAFYLLTGEKLFSGQTTAEICAHHIHTPPRPPGAVAKDIPEALDEVVTRCLAKKPDDRFASAFDLKMALEQIPIDQQWSREDAVSWWDAFDERESDPPVVAPAPPKTVTVDLRRR